MAFKPTCSGVIPSSSAIRWRMAGLCGVKSGTLCKNDTVEVDDAKAGFPNPLVGQLQHFAGIPAAIRLVRVGKQLANVAQGGGTEDRIGDRVQQHVGVAVPDQVPVVRHLDAAQQQRSAIRQPMRVVPNSDP